MFQDFLSPQRGELVDDITSWMDDDIGSSSDVDDFMRDVASMMDDDFEMN